MMKVNVRNSFSYSVVANNISFLTVAFLNQNGFFLQSSIAYFEKYGP